MNALAHPIIESTELTKDFGRTRALNDLTLKVSDGEIHGFLGPNGAGKSTTLRVLLGLIRPSSGTVRVFGRDPWVEQVRARRDIAYVPGDVSLWPNLTGGEVIDLLTGLRGGADEALRRRLITDFEFDPRKKSRTYSKGNRQKAALIAAFARTARLYLLDEPSSGLDPIMDAVFRAEIQRIHQEGATILLSSHILSEVEQLCDRVTIIRSGTAVETGTLADLRHLRRTRFRVTGLTGSDRLASLPGIHELSIDGTSAEFDADASDVPDLLAGLSALGFDGFSASPPSLESLFLGHYGRATPEMQ
ncbi:ABC transporter ATP-binding protein [Paenarthrobacter aromaticivorans]|uniref:ABC transporter ATP-binding protein n=1 Tax=Paenarthrobacter aromaticivorans TaxID=2849150 RepID=A0ABS6I0I7_9MICC|nr:ABC transporter ATP-binding protein [Paenarthrobacter sp. MMS21-TAE1-1]MBU8865139.1 ABC transporter ATP-binding protein [Paenarthrobacter sp. MMS21-TAE1-1]